MFFLFPQGHEWMSKRFLTKNTTFKVKEDEEYAVRKKHHGKVMNFLYEYMRMHSHILNCKFYYFYVTLKPYILIKLSLLFLLREGFCPFLEFSLIAMAKAIFEMSTLCFSFLFLDFF